MMQKRRRSTTRPSSSVQHEGCHEDGDEDVDAEEDAIHYKAELPPLIEHDLTVCLHGLQQRRLVRADLQVLPNLL